MTALSKFWTSFLPEWNLGHY